MSKPKSLIGVCVLLLPLLSVLPGGSAAAATTGLVVTSVIPLPDYSNPYSPGAVVTVDPSTRTGYAGELGGSAVSAIDTKGNVTDFASTPRGLKSLAADSSTHEVYALNGDYNLLSDIANGAVVGNVYLYNCVYCNGQTGDPRDVAVDASTHTVYVSDDNDSWGGYNGADSADLVFVINNGTVTDTIPVANAGGIAVDPTTHDVYVASGTDTLSEIAGGTVTHTIQVGKHAAGDGSVAVDPTTHNVYVTNESDNTVSVVHDSTVTATVNVGDSPEGIAVDPTTHNVYVANSGSDNVSVIDESPGPADGTVTDTVTDGTSTAAGPDTVAVDPTTHDAYVGNNSSDSVSVISPLTKPATTPTVTGTPPSAALDQLYFYQFALTGYPFGFTSMTAGSLPPGLNLAPSGELSGYPDISGVYNFTVSANNDFSSASKTVRMVVDEPTDNADLFANVSAPTIADDHTFLTVTFTVSNSGPVAAAGLVTNVYIPAGLEVTAAPGATLTAGTLVWTDPYPLALLQTITYSIDLTVDTPTPTTVTVGGVTESSQPDPDPSNNDAITTIRLG